MKKLGIILFFFLPAIICGQGYTLNGTIKNLDKGKIFISDFYGDENKVIDSVEVNLNGEFSFIFPEDCHIGMYRLRFGPKRFIDILFNHENIDFYTTIDEVIDSLVFIESKENRLYFEYLNKRNITEYKVELLGPVVAYYPEEDSFHKVVEDEFRQLQTNLDKYSEELINNNQGTYVAKIVAIDRSPQLDFNLSEADKINYLKNHFFDNANFNDTSLLWSNIIANKVIRYLSLYQDSRMPKDMLQVEFIKAVAVLMEVTKEDPTIYEYVMDYLIGGFQKFDFDKVITYIADNINLEESCVNSERKASLEKKVESLKKFAVGKKVPDFIFKNLNERETRLSETGSEYTLLLFWATWCPHCVQLMSKLSEIYFQDNKEKFEIVAVSLDESKEDLEQFLASGNYNWINTSDFKKWKGDLVHLYDIYATPTMFLLFSDGTILAKPLTFNELKNELFERNILH